MKNSQGCKEILHSSLLVLHLLVQRLRNTHLQSAKLGQSAQAADAGVAGIGLLAESTI